jgi:hypothetical protein
MFGVGIIEEIAVLLVTAIIAIFIIAILIHFLKKLA